jgi:hypothetical protein
MSTHKNIEEQRWDAAINGILTSKFLKTPRTVTKWIEFFNIGATKAISLESPSFITDRMTFDDGVFLKDANTLAWTFNALTWMKEGSKLNLTRAGFLEYSAEKKKLLTTNQGNGTQHDENDVKPSELSASVWTGATLQQYLSSGRSTKQRPKEQLVEWLCKVELLKTVDESSNTTISIPDHQQDDTALAALYEGFVNFYNVKDDTDFSFRTKVPGNYLMYRPSTHAPGHFVRALVRIESVNHIGKDGRQVPYLQIVERYHYRSQDLGVESFDETFIGTIATKSGVAFSVTCRQSQLATEDNLIAPTNRGAPRFTLFPSIVYKTDDSLVMALTGVSISPFAGGRVRALPVTLERIHLKQSTSGKAQKTKTKNLSTDALDETKVIARLGTFSKEDPRTIPDAARARLDQFAHDSFYVPFR